MEEKSTYKPIVGIKHLQILIITFHKKHQKEQIATSSPFDQALPRVKSMLKPIKAIKK